MKLKRFLLPILAWSGLLLTSCHCEHEEDDGLLSSLQVGNVVCSDGNILSMDKFKQSDKEAVAIVFHVNRSVETDNLGYAVYIHDMEPLAFADSLGIDQGTSASLTEEDGNKNTYSLFNNDEVKSPMAIKTFDLWSYGQSAYIPSVRQLSYLFTVRHLVNECISEVGGTQINLNRANAGYGHLLKWKARRRIRPGFIPCSLVLFRKHQRIKRISSGLLFR